MVRIREQSNESHPFLTNPVVELGEVVSDPIAEVISDPVVQLVSDSTSEVVPEPIALWFAEQTGLKNIVGVILAGTHPWGRCRLDDVLPRPLLPVANVPLITYAMNWLGRSGVSDITICGNNDTVNIRASLGSRILPGQKISYYRDPMPRGPAGCVFDAVAQGNHDIAVVVDGTIIPSIDMQSMLKHHRESGAVLTVAVLGRQTRGTAMLSDQVPIGVYVFSRRAVDHIKPNGYQDIKEALIPQLYSSRLHVRTFLVPSFAPRVTQAQTYLAVNDWSVPRAVKNLVNTPDYYRLGDACIHRSAKINSSVRFLGPVLVDADCEVGPEVTIVGPCSLGVGTKIGCEAVVCRSAVWQDCNVPSGCMIDRCIVTKSEDLAQQKTWRHDIC